MRGIIYRLAVCLVALGCALSLQAQPKTVTGIVKDANGEPIIGAFVLIEGTSTGASTGIDGDYSITVPDPATAVLQFSLIGMKTDLDPVMSSAEILEARKIVKQVYIDEKIQKYIIDIVFATRYPETYGMESLKDMIAYGASPRASINLALAARAFAFLKHRGYVIPEDVRAICPDVMRHRIGLSYEAEANNLTTEEVIAEILNKVEVP